MRTDDNGGIVRISDVARVELGASGYAQSATLDGKETCYIDVFRQTGANALATAWSFLVGVLPLVFSSGAGCESRQTIGLVTFCGLLVATVIGISFPPAYFALFSRLRGRSVRHG